MITLLTTLLGLGAIGFVAYVTRMNRQARRFVGESAEAMAALGRGDLAAAKQIFERWLDAKAPSVQDAARHGLAIVLIRQGEPQQAIAFLTTIREREKLTPASVLISTDVASAHALLGELEAAEQWLGKAAERADKVGVMFPALVAFPRAVHDCRAGRCDEAAKMLDEKWADYESMLNGQSLRVLRIVRAFAHAAAGPREAGIAESLLAAAKPAYPGEYAFLGKAWPEMATFLASHQLG